MANQHAVSSNTQFHVHYCYFMEAMTSVFYAKIDKICLFIQLLLGTAVMADVINLSLIGLIIAVIAAYQFIYSPATIASQAKQQAIRYADIIHDLPNSVDIDVQKKLKALEEKDSTILLTIRNASYIQSCIATGQRDAAEIKIRKLNRIKRFIIFLAGGIQN